MIGALKTNSSFFLTIAPIGPQGETWFPRSFQNVGDFPVFDQPVPPDRHKELHPGVKVPRGTNFDPDTLVSDTLAWKELSPKHLLCKRFNRD